MKNFFMSKLLDCHIWNETVLSLKENKKKTCKIQKAELPIYSTSPKPGHVGGMCSEVVDSNKVLKTNPQKSSD